MMYGECSKESLASMHVLGELHHLRWVCKDADAYDELNLALPLLSEALRGRRELFGPMDINTLSTMDKLSLVYHDMGDLESAQALAEEAVAGFTKILGDNHLYLLTAKQHLGQILRELELLDTALPLHVEAYEGKERAYGPDSPETIDSASALGLLYAARGENGSAAEILREAFKRNCVVRGSSHPSTVMTAKKLHNVLTNLKVTSVNETGVYNLELAELNKFIDSKAKNPSAVLAQLDSMASNVGGQRGGSIEILESVYDDCRKSHGNHDPRTLECLALIGWYHHVHRQNPNVAVNNLRQALVGLTNLVDENGVHHPLVPKVAKQLKMALERLSQQDGHGQQAQLNASEMQILRELCVSRKEKSQRGRRRVWKAAKMAIILRSALTESIG
jgi:tetratricopeptide (TPR) repeat protein